MLGPGSGDPDEVTVAGTASDVEQHLDHGRHGERLNQQVGDGRRVAGAPPAEHLSAEVVELCRPYDVRAWRVLTCCLFLDELGLVVTVEAGAGIAVDGGDAVYSDDGEHDGAADSRAGSGASEVRRDGREELRRRLLFEVRAPDDVDDGLDPVERLVQSSAGEQVDAGLLRDAGHDVAPRLGRGDELATTRSIEPITASFMAKLPTRLARTR